MAVPKTRAELLKEIQTLQAKLEECEETLRAIRAGEVDALVVDGPEGEQIFTLHGADHAYRVMVESMSEGALTVDTSDGTIIYSNESFAAMVDKPIQRVVGSEIRGYIAVNDLPMFNQLIATGMGLGSKTEFGLLTETGAVKPVLVSMSASEVSEAICLVVTDLTDHKRNIELIASQQIDTALHEQRETQLVREKSLRAAAEQANRVKEEFLATLSHELRTPLNAVLGWATILRNKKVDEDTARRGVEAIERNARSQAKLIEDLLDVSRITSGKLRLDIKPIQLITVIKEAIDSVRPAAEAKEVALEMVLDPAVNQIDGDASRLQQIVWNLVANAVKFTPSGGRVQVRLRRYDSKAQISVSDTGEGISEEFLPHVFARFLQADGATTRRYGGLGLGLAIARHLAEMHGGTIEATSGGLGQGATFTVTIPIAAARQNKSETNGDGHLTPALAPVSDESPNFQGLRILTIDDEADTRELVRAVLEDCGADVLTAGSAREGLDSLIGWKPHVLICDIGMPDEDGYSFIRKVRASEQGTNVPAIALTAYVRIEERMRALESGFQMFLPKPVEAAELRSTVASLFREKGSATPGD